MSTHPLTFHGVVVQPPRGVPAVVLVLHGHQQPARRTWCRRIRRNIPSATRRKNISSCFCALGSFSTDNITAGRWLGTTFDSDPVAAATTPTYVSVVAGVAVTPREWTRTALAQHSQSVERSIGAQSGVGSLFWMRDCWRSQMHHACSSLCLRENKHLRTCNSGSVLNKLERFRLLCRRNNLRRLATSNNSTLRPKLSKTTLSFNSTAIYARMRPTNCGGCVPCALMLSGANTKQRHLGLLHVTPHSTHTFGCRGVSHALGGKNVRTCGTRTKRHRRRTRRGAPGWGRSFSTGGGADSATAEGARTPTSSCRRDFWMVDG